MSELQWWTRSGSMPRWHGIIEFLDVKCHCHFIGLGCTKLGFSFYGFQDIHSRRKKYHWKILPIQVSCVVFQQRSRYVRHITGKRDSKLDFSRVQQGPRRRLDINDFHTCRKGISNELVLRTESDGCTDEYLESH